MIIQSDLTFSVAVPGRSTATGRVTAEGAHVTVDTTDVVALLDGSLGASVGSSIIRAAAEQAAAQHVTVSVTGPRGRVASVGYGVDSLLGRVVVGSRRVSVGRPAAIAPLVRSRARGLLHKRRWVAPVATATTLAAGGALARYLAREHPRS